MNHQDIDTPFSGKFRKRETALYWMSGLGRISVGFLKGAVNIDFS